MAAYPPLGVVRLGQHPVKGVDQGVHLVLGDDERRHKAQNRSPECS